jgi:hypothetical protein
MNSTAIPVLAACQGKWGAFQSGDVKRTVDKDGTGGYSDLLKW